MKTVQVALLLAVTVSLCFPRETTCRLLEAIEKGEERELRLSKESLKLTNLEPNQQNEATSQNTQSCPQLTCADPEYDSQQNGNCPNCDKSECKFRGCVHFGAFGPQWSPDPCTFCSCHRKRELCTKIECEDNLECYGYPSLVKEGDCCPTCDFGVPEDECGLIPTGIKSLYTALGDHSCLKDVVVHGCDKDFIAGKDGKFYRCRPMESLHHQEMGKECYNSVHQVTYMDIERCIKEEISSSELPQDLDFAPKSCAFYAEP